MFVCSDPSGQPLPKEILNNITFFTRKQKKGIIDVWWLYDDGGTYIFPIILINYDWIGGIFRKLV